MKFLHSRLRFDFDTVTNHIEPPIPENLYRYFSSKNDRDNFLKGNIWFAGTSQNRFFADIPDRFEYRNNFGSFLDQYSLSFSTEIIDSSRQTVMIIDPAGKFS